MTEPLVGKTVIMTGGGRGYGLCMSQAIARQGANVAIASRTIEESEAVAQGINDEGGAAMAIRADVADQADVQAMVEATVARFGKVDILVNNAAQPGAVEPLADIDPASWQYTFDVNVKGVFMCTRSVLPAMIERGAGHIVNLTSSTARPGFRSVRSIPYTTSKYAIDGLSDVLAVKLEGTGVRVNAFSPGLAETRFLDGMPEGYLSGRRCQTPDHVMEPIVYLLTEEFPSGEVFVVLDWLEERGLLDQFSYIHD